MTVENVLDLEKKALDNFIVSFKLASYCEGTWKKFCKRTNY